MKVQWALVIHGFSSHTFNSVQVPILHFKIFSDMTGRYLWLYQGVLRSNSQFDYQQKSVAMGKRY